MSDEDIPTSGSRWEPAAADRTSTMDETAVPAQPLPPSPSPVPTAEARPTRLPRRLRGRSAVAAAGVGLVLAGGLGGFAIGHAVAGDDSTDGSVTDQAGVPGDGNGRPDFRDGDHPGPDGVRPGPDGVPPDGGADDGPT